MLHLTCENFSTWFILFPSRHEKDLNENTDYKVTHSSHCMMTSSIWRKKWRHFQIWTWIYCSMSSLKWVVMVMMNNMLLVNERNGNNKLIHLIDHKLSQPLYDLHFLYARTFLFCFVLKDILLFYVRWHLVRFILIW